MYNIFNLQNVSIIIGVRLVFGFLPCKGFRFSLCPPSWIP